MPSSWADSVSHADNSASAVPRSSYVPPHLRSRPPPSSAAPAADTFPKALLPSPLTTTTASSGRRAGGSAGWERRDREPNPFAADEEEEEEAAAAAFDGRENTGINFDAYDDIPVETSGDGVPPPVGAFAEIDLGDALNANIRRCKYAKPTPVQRHAIPISLAGRDLMACAQTGSGKTAAFCFPIISGVMRCCPPQQQQQRPRGGSRAAYPLALILSPTRELSVQVMPAISLFPTPSCCS